ncbi:MAG TPA: 3-hydroxyacyl-CoA dehydrogenase NAD-binding domain-containing protein [Thermodesulfobacteriota bacterium]
MRDGERIAPAGAVEASGSEAERAVGPGGAEVGAPAVRGAEPDREPSKDVSWRIEDDIAIVTLDRRGATANVLGTPVMMRLNEVWGEIERAVSAGYVRGVVIISGKPDIFVAGADVNEIASITDPSAGEEAAARGQAIFERLARLPVKTIAAIHGACVGGGLEMVLACAMRIATDDPRTRLGLPEVTLGIIPGFGGTQRLPRLIGLEPALDLILTGRLVDAKQARRIGLVDDVVAKPILLDWAKRYASGEVQPRRRPAPLAARARRTLLERFGVGRDLVFKQAEKRVRARTGGKYPAPLRAIEAVRSGLGKPMPEALAVEARIVGPLLASDICKSLAGLYLLSEQAKKQAADAARPVARLGVLGAGIMGAGIAQSAAQAGLPVRLRDVSVAALAAGMKAAAAVPREAVRRRRMTPVDMRRQMGRISATTDWRGFARCDLVIEAVVEDLEVKRTVLAQAAAAAPGALLATNTSSIAIDAIAEGLPDPSRLVGIHFFNPVHRMPLVEVVRGARTAEEAVATAVAFARRLGKTPIVVKDGPGFLVNRLLAPYLAEAVRCVVDRVPIETIDRAMTDFGMAMGPLAVLDEVGFDTAARVSRVLEAGLGERMAPAPGMARLLEAGRKGKKGGGGFYVYDRTGKRLGPDRAVYAVLGVPAPSRGETAKAAPRGDGPSALGPIADVPAPELVERLLYPMINEAARVLDEGIVAGPEWVDLAMVLGTGFAPFRGGPLRYADRVGLPAVVSRLRELAAAHGPRFEPAPALVARASSGQRFLPPTRP